MKKIQLQTAAERRIARRNVIIALLVILFITGVIFKYYRMLYREKRENIIKSGAMTSKEVADQFNTYLAINSDFIKLAAYSLEGMLREQASEEKIQEFLSGESEAINSAILESSTGLYGYINGRFYSGTNWTPPEGFVATERPWYKKPFENPGEVTVLEPYVDAQSGNTMIAVGKTLSDGVSVVSVDISLDQIQTLVEKAVGAGHSDWELILNDKGMVVAHSDPDEIGKDYTTEKNTLEAMMVQKLSGIEEDYFEFKYGQSHYIVYVTSFQNDWCCLTIKDLTSVFRSLNVILFMTAIVIVFIVASICIVVTKINRRNHLMDQLKNQLSSTAIIYVSMHEVDFLTDSFTEVRINKSEIANTIGDAHGNCQQVIRFTMERFSDPTTREKILEFVDFSTLDERLKDQNTITTEFMNEEKKWRRARFIVSARLPDGRLSRAMYLVEDIDAEKRIRDQSLEAIHILNTRISTIADIYMTVHELDLPTDTFIELKSESMLVNDLIGESRIQAQTTLRQVMESACDKSMVDEVLRFVDLSTLQERMKSANTISIEYLNHQNLWRRGRFVASKRDEDGRLIRVLWLSEDINSEKKERDRLIDMSERAIAASEAKSSFLSNMSHEIRTPINVVLGMNEMILRECGDQNILAYSESIKTAGSTLLGLINDILDFSKIEAGKMEILPVKYDLSSVINDLVNMVRSKADDKGLVLFLDFDHRIPKLLKGDEIRVKQVITNILTNAVKYTEKGSVIFGISYHKDEEDPDSVFLDVSVKDTGIGIKQEDMKKLFSEFDRIEEERNRNIEGTGLGMNITKRLLEMMGSSLKVGSIYGFGSMFTFSLKQRVIDWEPLGDYEMAYREALKGRKKYKEKFTAPTAEVLVVDDNRMNLKVFVQLLKQTKIRIDTAMSGEEGLSLSNDKKYDIILLDHMMPKKDGIETLHELRAQEKNPNEKTPVICLTANAISGAREKYIKEGFDDYLTKPIEPARLEKMLMQYLPEEKIVRVQEPASGDTPEEKIAQEKRQEEVFMYTLEENDLQETAAGEVCSLPDFVMAIDEIDTEVGIKGSGSCEAYLDTLKFYAEIVDEQADEIKDLMAQADLENATIKIHALKSSSKTIGAAEIGELAQKLEDAGTSNDWERVESGIGELLERSRKLGVLLKPLLEEDEVDEEMLEPIRADRLEMAYAKIREYAGDCDNAGVEAVLGELCAYRIPGDEKERFGRLKEAVDNLDYEEIMSLLR